MAMFNFINKKELVICTFLIVIGIGSYWLHLKKPSLSSFNSSEKTLQTYQLDSVIVDAVKTSLFLQFRSEGVKLPKLLLVEDSHGQKIFLQQLIRKPVVVFRYSELNCQVCVDQEMKNIKRFIAEVGKDKVLIVSSYRNKRTLNIFKRINNLDIEIYNLKDSQLTLAAEQASVPYLFITDFSLIIRSVFVPVKEMSKLSEAFFSFAKQSIK